MEVHRGEVFYADLSPVVGSEQGGIRPVLIIQNEIGNRHSPTVIAAAITSRQDKNRLPTHISVRADRCGLAKDSIILTEQIRTLDKRRLREHMGRLDGALMDALAGTALAKLGSNLLSLFIVFGALYWVGMARLVRGQILSIKNNEYVLAAKAMGAKPRRIIRKHILPNCMSVIIISVALQIPSAIFTESFLSFIGLGVQAPMPSLGSLANAARGGMQSYPWKMLFPAMAICLIVLSFNLLGDGLRDAFDPKLRR